MKTIRYVLLSLCLLAMAASAHAYDAMGHHIVADVAYQNLSKKARKEVDKLLGKRGIIYAATWADEIRSDTAYQHTYPWHYQNLADSLSTNDIAQLWAAPTSQGEHLFYAIQWLTERLKANKQDKEALMLLVHLVGDAHQPMHLGRQEDLGGNKVKWDWFGRNTNLHSIWDGFMIESSKYSYTEYSQFVGDKYQTRRQEFYSLSLIQSIQAVYTVRQRIYNYNYSNKNNYHYLYHFREDTPEMIYRGGLQLAKLLNSIYG